MNRTIAGRMSGGRWLAAALMLCGMVLLTACGSAPASATSATGTPSASDILHRAQTAANSAKDYNFTLSMNMTASGQTITATGSGAFTKVPSRAKMTLQMQVSSVNVSMDMIMDMDGKASYIMLNGLDLPGYPAGKWVKSALNTSSSLATIDPSQFTAFNNMTNAKLVGIETVNGVSAYHLTGQVTTSGETADADFYVRHDNYNPVELVTKLSGASSGDVTMTFTGVNTGTTVALPSADQVQAAAS